MKITYNNDILKQKVVPHLDNAISHLNQANRILNNLDIPSGFSYVSYVRELDVSKYKNNIVNLKDKLEQSNTQLNNILFDMKKEIINMNHVQIKLRTNLVRKTN